MVRLCQACLCSAKHEVNSAKHEVSSAKYVSVLLSVIGYAKQASVLPSMFRFCQAWFGCAKHVSVLLDRFCKA
jgi:hypothetical protein